MCSAYMRNYIEALLCNDKDDNSAATVYICEYIAIFGAMFANVRLRADFLAALCGSGSCRHGAACTTSVHSTTSFFSLPPWPHG